MHRVVLFAGYLPLRWFRLMNGFPGGCRRRMYGEEK